VLHAVKPQQLLSNIWNIPKVRPFSDSLHFHLDKTTKHKNIINLARAQTLGWLGHIERMPETRMVKTIHCWKPISSRPTGRPKTRWKGYVKKDIVYCFTFSQAMKALRESRGIDLLCF
jgi:hypothetical protein